MCQVSHLCQERRLSLHKRILRKESLQKFSGPKSQAAPHLIRYKQMARAFQGLPRY